MGSRSHAFILGILLAASLIGSVVIRSRPMERRTPAAAMRGLRSPEAMWDDVLALADPSMNGRAEESGGAAIAAAFIEGRFRSLGLRVEEQEFEIPRRRLLGETRLETGGERFAAGADFAPLTWSGSGIASGPLVPGMASRICRASLAGQIAVERVSAAPGIYRTLEPPLAERALAYQDLGAAGVLFVADSHDAAAGGEAVWALRLDERTEARLKSEPQGVQGWLRDRAATGAQSRAPRPSRPIRIPAALVSYDAGRRFDETTGATARLSVSIEDWPLAGTNVLGLLPGAVPGRAAVIVCAHYDSHGRRPDGRLYPGACDNASGIAVLLAVADALAHGPRPLDRPVLFAAFGGEELGLHGSRAFAAALPHFKGGALCAFNVDMAARNAENEIFLLGSAFAPDLAALARASLEEAGFSVATTKGTFNLDATFRHGSDHWPLHQAGVPSVLVTCSRFPECDTPDDAADLCSPTKLRRVAKGVLAAVWAATRRQETFAAPVDAVVKFPGER